VIKAEFSASLLQSSVSHDPSEITLIWWFDAQETFLIINVENSCVQFLPPQKKVQKNSIFLKWKAFVTLNAIVEKVGVSKNFFMERN